MSTTIASKVSILVTLISMTTIATALATIRRENQLRVPKHRSIQHAGPAGSEEPRPIIATITSRQQQCLQRLERAPRVRVEILLPRVVRSPTSTISSSAK